eukprot:gb/GEZN01002855.1/.p1 GENE.gb/GEZN01002855.1/~~gb/GEZN01002855.1/.p1  ORF type:complete len:168 (+),score=11.72 gb/GEZN01002855.1/:808-1311(+)
MIHDRPDSPFVFKSNPAINLLRGSALVKTKEKAALLPVILGADAVSISSYDNACLVNLQRLRRLGLSISNFRKTAEIQLPLSSPRTLQFAASFNISLPQRETGTFSFFRPFKPVLACAYFCDELTGADLVASTSSACSLRLDSAGLTADRVSCMSNPLSRRLLDSIK